VPAAPASAPTEISPSDISQLAALRSGDEQIFRQLVGQYHGSMVRIARLFVNNRMVAEEVAQEAWLGVLRGLDRFEGRSSLKTWIFSIVSNLARTRGKRETRSIPFSFFENYDQDTDDPAVPAERFRPSGAPRYAGHWATPPGAWALDPTSESLQTELFSYLEQAIDALPEQQRTVITLRDIQGWTSDEVWNALGIGETNQRVLLHRARSKVRRVLEKYLEN
jgi:RNA polymerase sigma-70 factor, ECF subfamily